MTEAEIAYIAGILDGEGAICVRFRSGPGLQGHGRYLHFRVEISQMDERLITWLQPRIGGKVSGRASSDVLHLALNKSESVALLQAVRPYLIVKGEQADIFLAAARREYVNGRRIGPDELAERHAIVASMGSAREAIRRQRYADYTNQPEYAP